MSKSIFRAQAIEQHAGRPKHGQLLRLSPEWTRWTFWMICLFCAVTLVFSLVGTMHEYAKGPAILRVEGRTDLTAKISGTVAEVLIHPGERVSAGQPLVQFFVDEENADLKRLEQEFDLQLLKVLRDPADPSARQALGSLRAERDRARMLVAQRLICAPRDGLLSDVRIRPGQRMTAGDLILSLLPDSGQLSLVAFLPGRYRPMLRPGMKMRFELEGYHYSYRELSIDAVGDGVIGPAEAKRYLGPELADGVELTGPLVLVRAHLPWHSFVSDGRTFEYFDGLHATVQARVRTQTILVALIPALRTLFKNGR